MGQAERKFYVNEIGTRPTGSGCRRAARPPLTRSVLAGPDFVQNLFDLRFVTRCPLRGHLSFAHEIVPLSASRWRCARGDCAGRSDARLQLGLSDLAGASCACDASRTLATPPLILFRRARASGSKEPPTPVGRGAGVASPARRLAGHLRRAASSGLDAPPPSSRKDGHSISRSQPRARRTLRRAGRCRQPIPRNLRVSRTPLPRTALRRRVSGNMFFTGSLRSSNCPSTSRSTASISLAMSFYQTFPTGHRAACG